MKAIHKHANEAFFTHRQTAHDEILIADIRVIGLDP